MKHVKLFEGFLNESSMEDLATVLAKTDGSVLVDGAKHGVGLYYTIEKTLKAKNTEFISLQDTLRHKKNALEDLKKLVETNKDKTIIINLDDLYFDIKNKEAVDGLLMDFVRNKEIRLIIISYVESNQNGIDSLPTPLKDRCITLKMD